MALVSGAAGVEFRFMSPGPVSRFLKRHYRHFNAATVIDAAEAYGRHLEQGGQMLLSMAGAMSTAELGLSLSRMIREEKVHAIACTGANLEEDIFNLVAHDEYERVPNYPDLSPADELSLLERKMNRVTDTCIPEAVMRKVEHVLTEHWEEADRGGQRLFPHEFLYRILREGRLKPAYQIDVQDSWLHAAMERNLPIFVPGWEDSTLGNMYAAHCVTGKIRNVHTVRTGMEYLMVMTEWYSGVAGDCPVGLFQIGGGIAGDFSICVVPLLRQDLKRGEVPMWGYFCQISDSTTSYGSYSGAVPNEKITWGKLGVDTPRFMIESDATIVAPLVFALVLGW
jgi:deoxyhypusine synthase